MSPSTQSGLDPDPNDCSSAMDTRDQIRHTLTRVLVDGVIVAVRLADGNKVVDACRALARGGLSVLEITLTTPGALEAIETLADDSKLLVGGGTVLSVDDARRVRDAGGRFALSPVTDVGVIEEAHALGLLAVPGTATPTEIVHAHRSGADLVKVFPAGSLGGPDYLRRVRGPLPNIPLVPTNGPTAADIADYLAAGAVAVGVGGDEFFAPGFTPETVEQAARRIRESFDSARRGPKA